MNRIRRTAIIVLGLLVLASVVGATGRGESGAGTAQAHPLAGTTNEFGWVVPQRTIEFTEMGEQIPADTLARWNPVMDGLLADQFNVKIRRIAYEDDPGQRLNLMLASNDYPDVITILTPSQARQWYDLGKTQNLAPAIAEVGQTYKARLGDLYARFVEDDGEIHILPNYWGILEITGYAPQIRYDWYQEAGSPDIVTPDDYFNVLKTLIQQHPTNDKGETNYALSFPRDRLPAYELLGGMWGLKKGWKEDADHNLTLDLVFFVNY